MTEEEIYNKLTGVIGQFCKDPSVLHKEISAFSKKIKYLFDTSKYTKLLKSIFAQKKVKAFNDFAFEADFAYDFELKGQNLIYEIKQRTNNTSELILIFQKKNILCNK